jgi:DNA mismatch endonuclease (patch repair protein)
MSKFVRDKRSPVPLDEKTSYLMSMIRSQHTQPEIAVRKALWFAGLKGYRLHTKDTGRADISYSRARLAIFIHGCYWHRCPKCNLPLPKHNRSFWREKFKRNIERDENKEVYLREQGWTVLNFWECEVKEQLPKIIKRIRAHLES